MIKKGDTVIRNPGGYGSPYEYEAGVKNTGMVLSVLEMGYRYVPTLRGESGWRTSIGVKALIKVG